ncbi:hypothetical protein [Stenotrophomonas sp. ATs4]|uniref:hypothetical protein n=1 Tax=Stenotrophomonas sp. ATs4 TaxID=3402766 RepID=UPI003F70CFBC
MQQVTGEAMTILAKSLDSSTGPGAEAITGVHNRFPAAEFESNGPPHAAGSILAGISPYGKGADIAAIAKALASSAPGSAFARRLIESAAENYIGKVFDTECGEIEVVAHYVSRLTLADKLAQLEAACVLRPDAFGGWLEEATGVGYFIRKVQPATLYAYRTTPGCSATALYARKGLGAA